MANIRNLIHGSGLRVANLVASTCIGFFLMPFLVQSLGDRTYGFWTLVGTILGYYGVLDFGILSAVQFYVARAVGKQEMASANRVISTAFFTFAALGCLILIITILLSGLAPWFIKDSSQVPTFRAVLFILGVGFAIGFPGRAFLGTLCAHMRWDLVSQFALGALLLRTILSVVTVLNGGGLIHLAAITVLTDFIVYTGYYLSLRKIQQPFVLSVTLVTRETIRQLMGYSAFTFIAKIGDQLRFYVDAFVVGAYIAVGAVTHYAVAARLATTFMELMVAILGLLAPWFSLLLGNDNHREIKRVFIFATKISAFTATTIASLLILYGKPFITAWMGSAYLDAFSPLLVLTMAILVDVSQLPSVSYLYGVYRHRFLAYVTLGEGVANVFFSIFLASKYGMIGVALGTAIPLVIVKLFIQPAYVCRHIGLRCSNYYFGTLGRAVALAAISILLPAFFLSATFSKPNLTEISVLVGMQLLIAAITGYFTVFGEDERLTILRHLRQACCYSVREPVMVVRTPEL